MSFASLWHTLCIEQQVKSNQRAYKFVVISVYIILRRFIVLGKSNMPFCVDDGRRVCICSIASMWNIRKYHFFWTSWLIPILFQLLDWSIERHWVQSQPIFTSPVAWICNQSINPPRRLIKQCNGNFICFVIPVISIWCWSCFKLITAAQLPLGKMCVTTLLQCAT